MSKINASSMPVNATGRFTSFVLPTILLLLLQLVTPFSSVRLRGAKAASPVNATAPPSSANSDSAARLAKKLGQMPMTFEKNLGQTNEQVKFTARGKGYSLFLTPTEAVMTLQQAQSNRPLALQMKLAGANPDPVVTGLEPSGTVSNYYLGNDPSKFRTGVPHFTRVKYEQVYPGIDALYYGNQRELEYDFLVAPGIDPKVIKMTFQGAYKLSLADNGDLVIKTAGGELRHRKPVIYQTVTRVRQEVAGSFVLRHKQVSFAVGDYDHTQELVIDPTLSYSTYIGGTNNDYGMAIALSSGNVYLTGYRQSSNFPTNSAFDNTITGAAPVDAIVVKLDPTAGTSGLTYSTFLAGNGREEGHGIAVNSSGEAFVTGRAHSAGQDISDTGDPNYPYTVNSTTFPLTSSAYQETQAGGGDVFVTRLNSSGNGLVYSTLLGGGDADTGYAIALSSNVAYITGETDSTNFPLEPNSPPFQGNQTGTDAFVSKVDTGASGSGSLAFSTYQGGASTDSGRGIAVASSTAFIAGFTNSNSTVSSGTFPVAPGSPYQDDVAGGYDCFAAKITP